MLATQQPIHRLAHVVFPGFAHDAGNRSSGPWAIERNRKISVTDIENHTHGDAAFADYTVIARISRTF